eukprot:scaffold130178_cov28-Tisochrysis_lutea.AAC.3
MRHSARAPPHRHTLLCRPPLARAREAGRSRTFEAADVSTSRPGRPRVSRGCRVLRAPAARCMVRGARRMREAAARRLRPSAPCRAWCSVVRSCQERERRPEAMSDTRLTDDEGRRNKGGERLGGEDGSAGVGKTTTRRRELNKGIRSDSPALLQPWHETSLSLAPALRPSLPPSLSPSPSRFPPPSPLGAERGQKRTGTERLWSQLGEKRWERRA